MAKGAYNFLFLFFFLYVLTVCSSGTLVGFCYDARRNSATSSPTETILFLQKNKVSLSQIRVFVADHRVLHTLSNTRVPVNLYFNKTQVENLRNSRASTISWLKAHLMTFLPHVNITSIIVGSSSSDSGEQNELSLLLPTLKSIHSVLSSSALDGRVKVSVAFPLSFFENLNRKHDRDLRQIIGFVEKSGSFIILETTINGELSMGDRFIQLMVERVTSAAAILPYSDVSMVLTVRSSVIPSAVEVAQFTEKITRSVGENTKILSRITGLFAEISPMEEFEQKELNREEEQMFPSSHRKLKNNMNFKKTLPATKTILHDMINPPTTILPATPTTTAPGNPPPTIITVPSTNPVNTTPTNPATTPTNPVTTPVTVPMTPPMTTYPVPPPGSIPITTPVPPPSTTNSPPVLGQTWCLAKAGALESALQAALDYACGLGGADCSTIQQKGSCYNPNTLQHHASYAFNSYYQKNPVPSSCEFGGTAVIVITNPSTASCVYPSARAAASSGSSPPVCNPSSPMPPTSSSPVYNTSIPTPPTSSSPVFNISSPVPPTSYSPVFNASNPGSLNSTIFGSEPPPGVSTPVSISASLKPMFGCIVLVAYFVAGKLLMGI